MSDTLFCDIIQPQIGKIQPYLPGKPISELQRELGLSYISKLASNENPLGASAAVEKAIQQELKQIARYPDGSAFELKQALAEMYNVSPEQIAIGNGSNELLELVARVFAGPNDEVIYSQYAFAVYPIAAQVVGATGVSVPAKDWGHDLNAMLAAITEKTKLIYIANPNNPTGTLITTNQLTDFLAKVPEKVVVVLDEAYFEYAIAGVGEYPDGLSFINKYSNLIISRTFSKAYGLASLRIGYMIANKEIIQYINTIRAPFNVNHFALVAATAALQDSNFVAESVKLNQQGMRQVIAALDDLSLNYIPSVGNFLCIEVGEKSSEINRLLLKEGVIVRPVANYGMTDFLRVSIGSQVENQHFIDALKTVLKGLVE